jgi:hypothetical protein
MNKTKKSKRVDKKGEKRRVNWKVDRVWVSKYKDKIHKTRKMKMGKNKLR